MTAPVIPAQIRVSPADVRGWSDVGYYWRPGLLPLPVGPVYGFIIIPDAAGIIEIELVRYPDGTVEVWRQTVVDSVTYNRRPYEGLVILQEAKS